MCRAHGLGHPTGNAEGDDMCRSFGKPETQTKTLWAHGQPNRGVTVCKEATSISYPQGEHKWGQYRNTKGTLVGGKSPLSIVAERVWIPEEPHIVAEDTDDFEFAVGHIEDWKGRRSTIGYFEYCYKPQFDVTVGSLDDFLTHEQWTRIWQVAEKNGLGARRSQGGGQFLVTQWELIG